jgi:hypothetical protein
LTETDRIQPAKESASIEEKILELAARDKESAIVRLAIEIERELFSRLAGVDVGKRTTTTISGAVSQLVENNLLPPNVGKAIIDFRDIRNKVIHPTREGAVSEMVLTSAIDSGLRILRVLRIDEK